MHGVSTRKVDDLMKALGSTASPSRRSRASAASSTRRRGVSHAAAHRRASLSVGRCDVPQGARRRPGHQPGDGRRRSASRARASARCSASMSGPSEDRAFWTAFLRSLVKRGLKGVRLVISDAHEGLKQAISTVLSGHHVAALPRALHAQPARHRAARRPRGDRRDRPHHLRAARSRVGAGAAAQGRRRAAQSLSARRRRCSKRPPKTSWRTGTCRSSISGNCTAPIRSNG